MITISFMVVSCRSWFNPDGSRACDRLGACGPERSLRIGFKGYLKRASRRAPPEGQLALTTEDRRVFWCVPQMAWLRGVPAASTIHV